MNWITDSIKRLYSELVDYVNELLFYKGHSLKTVTLEQVATHMKNRPLCVIMKHEGASDFKAEKQARVGDEVRVYLSKDVMKFSTKIREKSSEEDAYFVEYFRGREDFPLQLMAEELIQRTRPSEALIIAEKGTTFRPGDSVQVYMPYLAGIVTHVNGFNKKVDVRYNFADSENAGRTRFFAKALQFWKEIPANFGRRSPSNLEITSAADAAEAKEAAQDVTACLGSEVADDAACEYKDADSQEPEDPEDPDSEQKRKVRQDLDEKGVALSHLCEKLRKHGVSETKIPLYAWQIFPGSENAVKYIAYLVKKESAPLNVLAAYIDLLTEIKHVEQKRLHKKLYNTFCQLEKHLLYLDADDKTEKRKKLFERHAFFYKLLESIDKTTPADKLKAERAKTIPDNNIVCVLTHEVEKDKAQLKNRQKPFQQWLKAFAAVVRAEIGRLDGESIMFMLKDFDRRQNTKTPADSEDESTRKTGPTSTAETVEQEAYRQASQLVDSVSVPISLNAALRTRILTVLFTIFILLFATLAYTTFGAGTFTLTILISVQGSFFTVFYANTALKQFEEESLKEAFAYHTHCIRGYYNVNFHDAFGRSIEHNLFKCFKGVRGCCCFRDYAHIRYHTWRCAALYKMIYDRRTKC